jgi:RNA polymerase sigma factor (sigma-70 family)
MEIPTSIDWSRADRHDTSDEGIRAAIRGTLAREEGADNILAMRFGHRCVKKIMTVLFGKYPEIPERDMEDLVQDSAADVVMQVKSGKLTEFRESPSAYLFETCVNEIKERGRRKKGHEVPFSQFKEGELERESSGLREIESTLAFVGTIAPPRARPDKIAIRREMLRALGAQVGRLPRGLREVAARTRQGMEFNQIARDLGRAESTVRSQYDDAETKLLGWLDKSGAFDALFLKKKPPLDKDRKNLLHNKTLDFLASLSGDCCTAFYEVHFCGKRVNEVARTLEDCRASVEALLAFAYWAMWRKGDVVFPKDFLSLLEPHPRYPDHMVTFTYW